VACQGHPTGQRNAPGVKKPKRKLSAAEKAEKRRRRKEYMTVFIGGKQKRVKRPPTIEGMDVDEFIRQNADPIWLHQNEMWEYMIEPDFREPALEGNRLLAPPGERHHKKSNSDEEEIELPF
jgi:uncharacterized protein YnzC (UPF0291/DUF896 family)